jgi:hypothetical protein
LNPPARILRLDGRAQRDGFVGILRGVQLRALRTMEAGAEPHAAAFFLELDAAETIRSRAGAPAACGFVRRQE